MTILQILDEIAATSSTKEKEAILRREKDNLLLRAVFSATYNRLISYHIKKIPGYVIDPNVSASLGSALDDLSFLASRKITGNDAIEFLRSRLIQLDKEDAIVLERVIDRDLRCGCSDTIASRVWPGLVPVFDVMLCDKDMSRIKYPAFAQNKCDGARVHLFFDGEHVKAMSRGGKEFQLLGALDEYAKNVMVTGECWDGELLVMNGNKVADRQTGNGILNKANKGTISQEEANSIVAVVWDIVDFTSTIPYGQRFLSLQLRLAGEHNLDKIQKSSSDKIILVNSIVVENEDEALEFFKQQLDAGEEGAIVKNADSKWVPKRSKDLCKLKEILENEMIIVGIFEGTGKYVGMLGGITCESSDGKINVNVGSGFSDKERIEYFTNPPIGKITTIMYNQCILGKNKTISSLFLPRFNCIRFDKSIADDSSAFC